MKKYIIFISILSIIFSCSQNTNNHEETKTDYHQFKTQLPKVLFITTGVNFEGEQKDLPKGVIVAIQSFNKHGVSVRLEPRDVLFDVDFLNKYSIIILSTATGYHDADRKYSLSYMTDEELQNLKSYVAHGGTLIAGDNIGRNLFDGTDRIVKQQVLNADNYPLAEVFGLTMKEKNMKSYHIKGSISSNLQDDFLATVKSDLWTLVADSITSKNIKTLAYWIKDNDSLPAITKNNYHHGSAYLLASSDFLNPIVSEGYWSVAQIEAFYDEVFKQQQKQKDINININPWPNGFDNAFCVSFNPQGSIKNYKSIINFLHEKKITPTFFVDGRLNDTIKDYLIKQKSILASTGYRYWNYDDMDYALSINDILRNESKWQQKFKGFRFPFTNPEFDGLVALDVQQYKYESSISANNFEFLHGSVVPYNLVINNSDFYKSTSIYEIAPTYHDDYFFLDELLENTPKNPDDLSKNIQLHAQYLQDYWQYSVKPYKGVMVYLGHPGITAYNKQTLQALSQLIDTVSKGNNWMSTTNDIVAYRKNLDKLSLLYQKTDNRIALKCILPKGIIIKNFSININKKPKNISASNGNISVKENGDHFSIVFDAVNNQEVIIND